MDNLEAIRKQFEEDNHHFWEAFIFCIQEDNLDAANQIRQLIEESGTKPTQAQIDQREAIIKPVREARHARLKEQRAKDKSGEQKLHEVQAWEYGGDRHFRYRTSSETLYCLYVPHRSSPPGWEVVFCKTEALARFILKAVNHWQEVNKLKSD